MATRVRDFLFNAGDPRCKHRWDEMGKNAPDLHISWYGIIRYSCFECGASKRVVNRKTQPTLTAFDTTPPNGRE